MLHVSPAILDVFKNNFYYFSSIKHLQSSSFDQLNTFFHCVNQIQLKLFQRLIAINNVTTITCNHWYFINQLHSVLFHQLHTIFAVSSINCNHLFVINHRQSLLFSSSRSFIKLKQQLWPILHQYIQLTYLDQLNCENQMVEIFIAFAACLNVCVYLWVVYFGVSRFLNCFNFLVICWVKLSHFRIYYTKKLLSNNVWQCDDENNLQNWNLQVRQKTNSG